jgi:CheY-like chemotaxis protein
MRPTLAADGRAALTLLVQAANRGTPFPLVLLDGMMPEMDGFTLATEIRQQPALRETTLIMLASGAQTGEAARSRALGVAGYLLKPIKQSELLDAITTALGLAGRDPALAALTPPLAPPAPRRRLRILLAEDNIVNQKLAVGLLTRQGHAVTLAADGREALTALFGSERDRKGQEFQPSSAYPFDVVLMDVQMPEMDGFEATGQIREHERASGRHLPIIAMTAYAMKGDRERCLEAGMDAYLAKPIKPRELWRTLETLLPPSAGMTADASAAQVFDPAAALGQVGGDASLLREIVDLFIADCPRLLREIHEAIARQDAVRLKTAAHSLKGATVNFAAPAAFEAAQKLEALGRTGSLAGAAAAAAHLEQELDRLKTALATLR